jgi:hypothetical protein
MRYRTLSNTFKTNSLHCSMCSKMAQQQGHQMT